MQPSPYTPGVVAREVPGRALQLAEVDERLSYLLDLGRLIGRIRIDTAARGLGKTSLLREMQRRAEARGAMTLWVTAGEQQGLVASVAEAVDRATRRWRDDVRDAVDRHLDHLKLTVGVPGVAKLETELTPARNRPSRSAKATSSKSQSSRSAADALDAPDASGIDVPPSTGVRDFEDVIRATVEAARSSDHQALVLFVDELQAADPAGLRVLAYAWQHLQSEGQDVPAAVFAAGLPNTPDVITEVVTFSERFAFRPLDRLDDDAAMVALAAPARASGVVWDDDALAAAVAAAQGYPYTVQLLGDATWAAAGHPDPGTRLTSEHVAAARRAVRDDLDALFRARWSRSTPGEQRFLRAMAALGGRAPGPVRRAELARALGVSSEELSVPRARLIDKGIITAVARGELDFTVPDFAEWIRSTR